LFRSALLTSPDCVRLLAFARGSAVEEQTDDAARHRIAAHAAAPAKGVRHTEIHFTDGALAGRA